MNKGRIAGGYFSFPKPNWEKNKIISEILVFSPTYFPARFSGLRSILKYSEIRALFFPLHFSCFLHSPRSVARKNLRISHKC